MTKRFDLVGFGEAMVRFTPPEHVRLEQAQYLNLAIAAAELNVCVNTSTLGIKTKWVSKLVDTWSAKYVVNKGREHNVNMDDVIIEKYDGSGRKARNGLCFIEVGIGPRASRQIYDRGHSAISQIKEGEIDWRAIFAEAGWYHTTGITCAISPDGADEAVRSLKIAKELGLTTSFDLNFRSTLWTPQQAQAAMAKAMPYIDVLIGNEEDFETMLGIKADETTHTYSKLDPMNYKAVAEKVCAKYPNVKTVGTTLREVKTATLNDWRTVAYHNGEYFVSRKYENLEIYDRTGGGDSFASALIYSLITGEFKGQDMIEFSAAYSALCHGFMGDWNWAYKEEAESVMKGGSARVKR